MNRQFLWFCGFALCVVPVYVLRTPAWAAHPAANSKIDFVALCPDRDSAPLFLIELEGGRAEADLSSARAHPSA